MGEQGTNRKRYGAKLDGRHRMRMVIGRDGKLLEGDEVGLVGMVTETIVIGHQIFATVSPKRGAIFGPEDRVVNG
jgi:hypothetical protein